MGIAHIENSEAGHHTHGVADEKPCASPSSRHGGSSRVICLIRPFCAGPAHGSRVQAVLVDLAITCGAGTSAVGGQCVAVPPLQLSCGRGTEQRGAECVADAGACTCSVLDAGTCLVMDAGANACLQWMQAWPCARFDPSWACRTALRVATAYGPVKTVVMEWACAWATEIPGPIASRVLTVCRPEIVDPGLVYKCA
jgi:hypothetical protein